jgi:hypothetical protein
LVTVGIKNPSASIGAQLNDLPATDLTGGRDSQDRSITLAGRKKFSTCGVKFTIFMFVLLGS